MTKIKNFYQKLSNVYKNLKDKYFQNKTPVFTIILSLASIALAMYVVLKDLIKPNK